MTAIGGGAAAQKLVSNGWNVARPAIGHENDIRPECAQTRNRVFQVHRREAVIEIRGQEDAGGRGNSLAHNQPELVHFVSRATCLANPVIKRINEAPRQVSAISRPVIAALIQG